MIAVSGATGRVGRQVVEALLKAGQPVRALGRSQSRLAELARLGAQTATLDVRDASALSNAFAGTTAAFIVMPHDVRAPDYHAEQDLIGTSLASALSATKVRHIVFLSAIGADHPEGTGVVSGLHRHEHRLKQLSQSNVLMLRAGAFYENLFDSLPSIREQGIVADAIDPDLWVPMIATRDIARIAADALVHRDWQGVQAREISGPRDLTYSNIARIIGQKLGRPELTYVQVPYDAMIEALQRAGFSRDVATQYVGLSRGLNEGRVAAREPHSARHVGAVEFETFAEELAAAYRQSAS